MKGIMGLLVIGGGTVMAFVGAKDLATVGSPPFHYDSATEEEQQTFLQSEAESMSKGVKRSLISPSGVGPSFRLKETDVNPRRRVISFNIVVSGAGQANSTTWSTLGEMMQERACPSYSKSRLFKNRIQVHYEFMEANENPIETVRLSENACSRHV